MSLLLTHPELLLPLWGHETLLGLLSLGGLLHTLAHLSTLALNLSLLRLLCLNTLQIPQEINQKLLNSSVKNESS